jgi:hypothetical protein
MFLLKLLLMLPLLELLLAMLPTIATLLMATS